MTQKITTTLCLVFLFIINASTQGLMHNEWDHYGQLFYDIDATGEEVIAAGENIIIESQNGGDDWTEIPFPYHNDVLKHISKISQNHYVAAGTAVYISENKGIDWKVIENMTGIIRMENFGNTVVIERENVEEIFMLSDDGGYTWNDISPNAISNPQNLEFVDENNAYFTNSEGDIFRSTNGGTNWTKINSNSFSAPIDHLSFKTIDEGYLRIDDEIYQTTNGGIDWTLYHETSLGDKGLYSFDSAIYMKSFNNFRSYDGTTSQYIVDSDFYAVPFVSDLAEANGHLYLTGVGTILKRQINGSDIDWTDLTPGPNDGFQHIDITDDLMFVSGSRFIQTSTDKAQNFTSNETSFTSVQKAAIAPDNAIYITQFGLKRSYDQGENWEFVVSNANFFEVFEDGKILVVGSNGAIKLSTDNGVNFEDISTFNVGLIRDMYFVNPNFGWILNASGNALRTLDGGLSWEEITFPFGSSPSAMHFINDQIGFGIKTRTNKFWKTTDGGTTWEDISFTEGTPDFHDVYFIDANHGYVAGAHDNSEAGVVFETTDGGDSWTVFQSGRAAFRKIMRDETTGLLWLCGDRGQLYSYHLCSDIKPTLTVEGNTLICNEQSSVYKWFLNGEFLVETNMNSIEVIQEGSYSVRIEGQDNCTSEASDLIVQTVNTEELIEPEAITIYPNPSSGELFFKTTFEHNLKKIIVFDLTGQKILEERFNGQKLNLQHLPEGWYFLQLHTDKGYTLKRVFMSE